MALLKIKQVDGLQAAIDGAGGGYSTVSVSSSPYTATPTSGHTVYKVDCTSGAITFNLPTAVGNTARFDIKKIDSSANAVTIDGNSTETIDGGTTAVINRQYTSLTLVSDDSNWQVI